MPNIGDLRVREFMHPDSGYTVPAWEVERYSRPILDAHQKGPFWKRITPGLEPFTSKEMAGIFMQTCLENTGK